MPEFFQLAVTLPGIILKLQTEKTWTVVTDLKDISSKVILPFEICQ